MMTEFTSTKSIGIQKGSILFSGDKVFVVTQINDSVTLTAKELKVRSFFRRTWRRIKTIA